MGISILELVLMLLQEEGFAASAAYPGQKYPQLSQTVAAVHIEKVDRSNLSVTLEVNIISPASLGGTACETEALRATEILRWIGGECIQSGCRYDGVSQVYIVPILATFVGTTEAADCTLGHGFSVYINNTLQGYVTRFHAEEETGFQAEYVTAEAAPVSTSKGKNLWHLQIEDLIPVGSPESVDPVLSAFQVKLVTDQKTEIYYHCRWIRVTREFTRSGLRRIRTGIALRKGEE